MHTVQAMFLTTPGASNLSVPSLACGLPRARQRLQAALLAVSQSRESPLLLRCFVLGSYPTHEVHGMLEPRGGLHTHNR